MKTSFHLFTQKIAPVSKIISLFILITWSITFCTAQCTQNCNMIGNGEFENVTMNCISSTPNQPPYFDTNVSCWKRLSSTPDLFGRNCTTQNTIPTTNFYTDVSTDTWNNDQINNNHFLGLYGIQQYSWNTGFWEATGFGDEEGVQTTLASPIQAGRMLPTSTSEEVALYDDEDLEPRSLKTKKNSTTNSKVFPNPTFDHATLRFGEFRKEVRTIQVVDMTGKIVTYFNRNDTGQDYFLNVERIPIGAYKLLLLNAEGAFLEALSLIKQ